MIFKKRSTWSLFLVFLITLEKFASLRKTSYDFKQTLYTWFAKFFDVLTSLSFHSSDHDLALFLKCTFVGRILISLYVDDMIIISHDVDKIVVLKSNLTFHYEMKDLGALWYFLCIEVTSSLKGYLLSQSKYTIDILDQAHLIDTKTVDTSFKANVCYSSFDGNLLSNPTLYCIIVGSLVYLTIIRLDIAYVVHIVSLLLLLL